MPQSVLDGSQLSGADGASSDFELSDLQCRLQDENVVYEVDLANVSSSVASLFFITTLDSEGGSEAVDLVAVDAALGKQTASFNVPLPADSFLSNGLSEGDECGLQYLGASSEGVKVNPEFIFGPFP